MQNLKQQDIADKFGVNHATVNNLINGHTYGQAVTLGYIMPDRRKVDEANKAVLALLFGTNSGK